MCVCACVGVRVCGGALMCVSMCVCMGQNQGHGAKFFFFKAIQTFRSHNLILVQARKLILSVYVYLIYKFYVSSCLNDFMNS